MASPQRGVPGSPRVAVPGPLLGQVEGVEPGPQFLAQQQVGEGLVLGGEPLVAGPAAGRGHQVNGPVGRRGGAVQLAVGEQPRRGHRLVPVRRVPSVGGYRPGHLGRSGQHAGRPAQRLGQEVGWLEHRVGDAERVGLRTAQHAVLAERVLDDDLQRVLRADQVRQQVGATPAGQQAEEALGERDRGDPGGDRPVRAVQREFQAAAEGGAVHERERRHAQLTEPPEHRVPEPGDGQRLVPRGDQRGAAQVGADREDERLAGDPHGGDVGPRRHRVQRAVQREQPGRAERARPGVVEPVVQRDERHRAGAVGQFHVAHQRPGDDFLREQRGEKRRVRH